MVSSDSLTTRRYHLIDIASASLLTLLAFFFRTFRLAATPPAFDYDEAAHAIDALQILAGDQSIFSTKIEGVPTFFMYLEAGFFHLLGTRTFSVRLMVAFIATLTIPLVYLLGRELFRSFGPRRSRIIGGLGALGLAVSHWHVNYSRTGLEYALVPFFAVVILLLLWRGLRLGDRRLLALSGAWLGLSVYVYHTPRFLPIVVVLFLVLGHSTTPPPENRKGGGSFPRSRRIRLLPALLWIAIPAIVVFAPLGAYFALHPDHFLGRASHTLFTNASISGGDPWGALWRGVSGTFGAFGLSPGDFHAQANLPGKPILDPPMAVLIGLGLAAAIARVLGLGHSKDNTPERGPLLLLLWWLIMLIPAAITPDRVPNFARMLSAAPAAYLFIALGADVLIEAVKRLDPQARRVTSVLVAVGLGLIFAHTAGATWTDYFYRWAPSEDAYQAFHGPAQELARIINDDRQPGVVYILPCDPLAGDSCDYYTLDFFARGGPPHHAIRMSEADAPLELTEAAAGKQTVRLVYLKKGKRKFLGPEGDPKEMLAYWLGAQGRLEHVEPGKDFDIVTYRLPSPDTRFALPVNWRRVDVPFGEELWLRGASLGLSSETAESGGNLPVALRWDVLKPPRENYRATLRLTDPDGHLVAQIDRLLMDYGRRRASKWLPDDSPVTDFSLLPMPSTLPPGPYTLSVGLYPPSDEVLVPIDGPSGRNLREVGAVQIVAPAERPDYRGVDVPNEGKWTTGPSLEVAGFSLGEARSYPPGGRGVLSVFWRTQAQPGGPLTMTVQLEGRGRVWDLAKPREPLIPGDERMWQPGRLWERLYDVAIPADIPSGEYRLGLRVADGSPSAAQTPRVIDLAALTIEGRTRRFDIPPMKERLPASFGLIELLGLDSAPSAVPVGSKVELTLFWRATQMMQTGFTLFVHLVDAAGAVRAQRDVIPSNGDAPTTGWLTGEVISELVSLPLPPDLPPGNYRVLTGWYDAATGDRLSVDSRDYVELQAIELR